MSKRHPKDDYFSTAHLKSGLKELAVRSTGITLAAQGVKLALNVLSIAILARLLQPSDFGLIAMVTVFTGLALHLMEGGLSMATIQSEEITDAQVSTLFWINGALGAGLFVIGIFVSPLISRVYDEPKLALIMSAMSSTFLIGGLSVQHDALLRRQMRFGTISVIDVVSLALGLAAGVLSALADLGYWALVISAIATFLSKTLMRWFSIRWVPSIICRNSGVRPLLEFGANLTGANFIGYLATNVTPFAVGFIGGAQSMGVYNRAQMLATVPLSQMVSPVINVLQPTLARVANDPARLRNTIVSVMGKLALCTMFVTLTMAVLADWFVEIFLGPGWDDAVPVFRMLAIFSLVEPVAGFLSTTLVATGNARALLRWKSITLCILVVSVAIGSLWGALGVVAAYALSGLLIRLPLFLYYVSAFVPLSFADLAKTLVPSGFCAAITAAVLYAVRISMPIDKAVVGIVTLTAVAAASYLALSLLVGPTRRELAGILTLIKFTFLRKLAPK